MKDKKSILIVSNEIDDALKSLQRALLALGYSHGVSCLTYGQAFLQIANSMMNAEERVIEKAFENTFGELQTHLSEIYLEKRKMVEEAEWVKYDGQTKALQQIESEIQSILKEREHLYDLRAAAQGGGPEKSKARDYFNRKLKEFAMRETALSAQKDGLVTEVLTNIEQTTEAFEKEKIRKLIELQEMYRGHKEYVAHLLAEIPSNLPAILLEELWLEIQTERDGRILTLLRQFNPRTAEVGGDLLTGFSLADIRRNAVLEVIRHIQLIVVFDMQFKHDGVRFLRRYWAEHLRHRHPPPPIIFISPYDLSELVRQDPRYFILHAEGAKVLTFPFRLDRLGETIRSLPDRRPDAEMVRDYVKKSCALAAEGIIEHKWRNFSAPFSLLRGAYYAHDVDVAGYKNVLRKLGQQENAAYEEAWIYDAIVDRTETDGVRFSDTETFGKVSLRELLAGKHVLVVDDEAESSGLKETLKVLLGTDVVNSVAKSWRDSIDLLRDEQIHKFLTNIEELEKHDVILLDLYLTSEDEEIKTKYPHTKPPVAESFGGIRLLDKLTQNEDFTVPIIMFTATTRTFNIIDAKVDAYFQKRACYHKVDEAITYYNEFKELIKESISWERSLLRHLWKCLQIYKRQEEYSEATDRYLESAYFSLKAFMREKRYPFLVAAALMLGSAVEDSWDRTQSRHVYNPISILAACGSIPIKDIYAFIAHQVRNAAAHPLHATIETEDVYFAFFSLFNALGIGTDFPLFDPCPGWELTEDVAKSMVESLCNNACPGSQALCARVKNPGSSDYCNPAGDSVFYKAAFLSFDYNLKQMEALKNELIFRYLLFLICLGKAKCTQNLPDKLLNLVKIRITQNGKFPIPFADGLWLGIRNKDGTVESALGRLEPGMFKVERTIDNRVFFHPTRKYLRP